MKAASRRAIVVSLAVLCAACAGPALRPVDRPQDLDGGEVVLVGKVRLTPPLDKDDQVVVGFLPPDIRNKVTMILDDRLTPAEDEPSRSDYGGRIEAPLERTFFRARKREPFFIRLGVIVVEATGQGEKKAYLPAGFRVDVRPGDRAVYLGTIHYRRDEFFQIKQVTVEDDYEQARAEFRKKFGSRLALRKALAAAPTSR